ncbi:hypothetical protein ABW20_dc0102804 [Dactylellina cionopaga]|nr:hypothetical protein ABW20_dc0102804 [Dactylellina cionopaga]
MASTAAPASALTNAKSGTTVVLYAFEKHSGIPSASPFCQKIECYFRFASLLYTQTDTLPFKAPKKKLPYVTVDDVTIADSQFIIRHLKENGIADLDKKAGLRELQIAESLAYRGFWEEGIYPAIIRSRWFIKENEPVIAQEIFGDLPFFVRVPLRWWYRRNLISALVTQGIGRHTDAEVNTILREALESLETRLTPTDTTSTSAEWFHKTATPTDIDAVISAILINICGTASNPYQKDIVLKSEVLREYTKMVAETYFPEFKTLLGQIAEYEAKSGAHAQM